MKKFLLLAIVCLPMLFGGCAKRIVDVTITIYGTVVDADTHLPINNALLWLSPNTSGSRYTGSDGYYAFSDIDCQNYTVWVSKDGYGPDKKDVTPNPGEKVEVTFVLKKE